MNLHYNAQYTRKNESLVGSHYSTKSCLKIFQVIPGTKPIMPTVPSRCRFPQESRPRETAAIVGRSRLSLQINCDSVIVEREGVVTAMIVSVERSELSAIGQRNRRFPIRAPATSIQQECHKRAALLLPSISEYICSAR
jgi:hypothetical protein